MSVKLKGHKYGMAKPRPPPKRERSVKTRPALQKSVETVAGLVLARIVGWALDHAPAWIDAVGSLLSGGG